MDFAALSEPFARDVISWRCQTVSKSGDKGLALAYIDARDVMNRLDAVCTPAGWQDRYEVHGSKTICYLSLLIDGAWVTKADGAGDTDVEAEKGSISDAFKRVAVKWGIGRYLYDIEAPWVPCETYEVGGKKRWSRWTADPWQHVRGQRSAPQLVHSTPARDPQPAADVVAYVTKAKTTIAGLGSASEVYDWFKSEAGRRNALGIGKETAAYQTIVQACEHRRDEVSSDQGRAA